MAVIIIVIMAICCGKSRRLDRKSLVLYIY